MASYESKVVGAAIMVLSLRAVSVLNSKMLRQSPPSVLPMEMQRLLEEAQESPYKASRARAQRRFNYVLSPPLNFGSLSIKTEPADIVQQPTLPMPSQPAYNGLGSYDGPGSSNSGLVLAVPQPQASNYMLNLPGPSGACRISSKSNLSLDPPQATAKV